MDKKQFCTAIKKYEKQLFAIAYAILKNVPDAEDAVCSAIEKGYQKMEQLKDPHKFRAWITVITRNEAILIKRRRLELLGDDLLDTLLEPTVDVHDEMLELVLSLPEEYRTVLILYYYNELSIREIGDILKIPHGTVKSRMSRGRRLLKEALEEGERVRG